MSDPYCLIQALTQRVPQMKKKIKNHCGSKNQTLALITCEKPEREK